MNIFANSFSLEPLYAAQHNKHYQSQVMFSSFIKLSDKPQSQELGSVYMEKSCPG